MPGYIKKNNPVGIGSSSGAETSLNLIANIKSPSVVQNYPDSKPVDLKKWFQKYAIIPNLNNGVYTNVKWSEFYESAIFGCNIAIKNESYERYGRNNDGGLKVTPVNGSINSGGGFTLRVFNAKGGTELAQGNGTTTFTVAGFDATTYYVTLTNTHPTGSTIPSMTFGFFWKCDYNGTGGQLRSDPADSNSFNTLGSSLITVVPTNQGNQAGGYSDTVTLLSKPSSYGALP